MALMKYKDKITLFGTYFDTNDKLTAKSILSIFQDIASIQAEHIGVGYKTMLNKNLYWVLSRVKFDIIKMPEPNQVVIATTWPHEKGKIDFDRDLTITSEDGELLITATSKWCVIDTIQRKLQRTENVNYIGEIYPEVNYTDKFNKISPITENLNLAFIHKVKFSDLDHNKHMNNTNYCSLVLNATENNNFSHFEINFLNECLLNDEISVYVCKTEDGDFVTGKIDDKTIFNAIIR